MDYDGLATWRGGGCGCCEGCCGGANDGLILNAIDEADAGTANSTSEVAIGP